MNYTLLRIMVVFWAASCGETHNSTRLTKIPAGHIKGDAGLLDARPAEGCLLNRSVSAPSNVLSVREEWQGRVPMRARSRLRDNPEDWGPLDEDHPRVFKKPCSCKESIVCGVACDFDASSDLAIIGWFNLEFWA